MSGNYLFTSYQICFSGKQAVAPLIFIVVISGFQTALFWSHSTAIFSLSLSTETQLCTYDHIMRMEREEGYYWGTKKKLKKYLSRHWCIKIIFEKRILKYNKHKMWEALKSHLKSYQRAVGWKKKVQFENPLL